MTRALTAWAALAFAVNLGFSRLSYGVALPALHAEFPASYGAFGVVNAVNLAGYLIGTLVSPFVARDSRLCGRGFVVSTLLVGIGLAGSAFVHDVVTLALWRALVGVASAVAVATTAVLAFERVAPQMRGRTSAAMWAGLALGLAAAGPWEPFIVGSAPIVTWRVMWLAMAALAPVAAIGFGLTVRRLKPLAVAAPVAARFDSRDLLRPRRFLYLGLAYFAFGAAYITYATFAVALFRAHGLPAEGVGLAWVVVGLAGAAGAMLAGRLADSPRGDTALALSFVFGVVGSAIAVLPSLAAALASAVLYGAGTTATPAIVTALARHRSTAQTYAANFSAVTTMLSVGQFVGPLVAAPFVDRYGLVAAATFSAIVFVGGIVFAALDARFVPMKAPAA